jgi:glycerol-3-phosphate dehydrogenase
VIARRDALAAFEADSFDLVVVGGGITGAGVALDAASRGYSVALVEREDFASGTSSRSSKLVHGGLRYLESFDLGLVREALLERSLMVRLAPHLVRPLPLLVPAFDGRRPNPKTGVGLNMYDVMATERLRRRSARPDEGDEVYGQSYWSPERHRTISGEEALEMVPALAPRKPTSAYLFYDCQTDDVRLVLTVLGEAERFGAVCANRCEAVGLLEEGGRAAGVRVRDRVGGADLALRADNVVNATGVWADRLQPRELAEEVGMPSIRPSRGTHVTLAHERLPMKAGAIVPAGDGRTIFALPWLGRTLIGTTDRDYSGPLEHVPPAAEDVEYLLAAAGAFFGEELGVEDLTGAFAGARPLISAPDARRSVDISRRAELYETSSGLVTITGGKLTTWRRMAKLAVDRVVDREGRQARCRTHHLALGEPVDADELPGVDGVGEEGRVALAARYGHAAHEVLTLAADEPELAVPLVPGLPDLLAEGVHATRREQAQTLGDVLLRRTRVGILDARATCGPEAAAPRALAEAMGAELGWSPERVERELEAWRGEAAAEGILAGAPVRGGAASAA